MIARQLMRKFTTSAIRRSGHDVGGIPGGNIPFNNNNKYVLTLTCTIFFGSAFGLPFLIARHHMLK